LSSEALAEEEALAKADEPCCFNQSNDEKNSGRSQRFDFEKEISRRSQMLVENKSPLRISQIKGLLLRNLLQSVYSVGKENLPIMHYD
jgi:hypothetical protein